MNEILEIVLNGHISTDGKGLWSDVAKIVRVGKMTLEVYGDSCFNSGDFFDLSGLFGEARVYFNTEDWDIEEHGLIYSDEQFLKVLKMFVSDFHGLDASDLNFSEQGMQGVDYVSFDAGPKFINSWRV
jgi:hypothetical protein